jgi:protein-S-isoprenylcysteine O-methyltransferase Ste14
VTGLADGVVVAAWAVVLAHDAMRAVHGHAGDGLVRRAGGAVLLAVLVGMIVALERLSGGRRLTSPVLEVLGMALAVGGAALHVAARHTLGAAWSARITPPGRALVEDGPFGVVRHPLYLGIGLVAVGTLVAHPSIATASMAVGLGAGLAVKIPREERALAAAFGPRWDAYRVRVPCLVPRLSSGRP